MGSGRVSRSADALSDPGARRGLKAVKGKGPGPTAVGLDPLIHGKVRLGILSALAVADSLNFTDLKQLLDTTDGNLSSHARRLEDAGYVACRKSFVGRVPNTEYTLTGSGRKALEAYLAHMESLIQATRGPSGSDE